MGRSASLLLLLPPIGRTVDRGQRKAGRERVVMKRTLAEIDEIWADHLGFCDDQHCDCGRTDVVHLLQVIEGLIEYHRARVAYTDIQWPMESFGAHERAIAKLRAAAAVLPPDVIERLKQNALGA